MSRLNRGFATLTPMLLAAVLLSGCTGSLVATAHPCPDSALTSFEVRRASVSQPIIDGASELGLPAPSCSFTWTPAESQRITEDLWVLAEVSDAEALLDELADAVVASEWELYMEQSAAQRMFVPAGAEDPSTRLIVTALDPSELTNRSLESGSHAVAVTLIEDRVPDAG